MIDIAAYELLMQAIRRGFTEKRSRSEHVSLSECQLGPARLMPNSRTNAHPTFLFQNSS
jgi:hypothetical protein